MYLIDTNVISEHRKQSRANPGVRQFFKQAAKQEASLFISAITMGELRCGVEVVRHRNDQVQAAQLETWLQTIVHDYANRILDFTLLEAQVWGCLRVPHQENALDKQIAEIALTCGLVLVTRNISDFANTGVSLLNPFEAT